MTRTHLKSISWQYLHTRKYNEPEKILGFSLVSGDEPPVILEPGIQTFRFPAVAIPAKLPAVLMRRFFVVPAGRDDRLDAAVDQKVSERIRVICTVGDYGCGTIRALSVPSASFTSAGEVEATMTETDRLLPSQIAMILLPFPRLVEPTQGPFFWRLRTCSP